MNIEELIAANAPDEGRSEAMHPSHSLMAGTMVWVGSHFKGTSTVAIDSNTGTTYARLTPDELERLGAMLIAQSRWMRQQP